jgi:hypothetical protein
MDKDGGESELEDIRAVLDLSESTLKDLRRLIGLGIRVCNHQ